MLLIEKSKQETRPNRELVSKVLKIVQLNRELASRIKQSGPIKTWLEKLISSISSEKIGKAK